MGAWTFIEPNLEWVLDRVGAASKRPRYVGRAASAATATGLASRHNHEQKAVVEQALAA
jgi:2-oxoglutarate dehydrogenase E1 component